ncbi:uncharacterized protein L201_007940 [Kwoniella dendrophila CBS 6074]|uniref:Uncharacterized protein n=1 Tax=Kwoniella dendrophila CBS 6074 TaxID=1295534 RepID=A0AAX4K5S0_9TREE
MLRSLLSRRSRKSKSRSNDLHRTTTSTTPSSTPSIVQTLLIPDILPLVIPYSDQGTLFSLCLVDRHTNRLVSALLNDTVYLHTPSVILSFLGRPKKRKVKHIDLILDIRFWLHSDFRKCTLQTAQSPAGGKGWLDKLESLHLITRGEGVISVIDEKLLGRSKETIHDLQQLVEVWIKSLTPSKGPKHLRWRHEYISVDTTYNDHLKQDQSDIVGVGGYEDPYPGFRWPFRFLSDYTSILSLDLPLTFEPIYEGFKLSNLELQVIQLISLSGFSLSPQTLSGILWEINNGKRSKKKDNKPFILEVRGDIKNEIRQGLDQLIEHEKSENKGLLQVSLKANKSETSNQWRERIRKQDWCNIR